VTNPIFESSGSWDLLCDVGGGRIVVSKDVHSSHPPSGVQVVQPSTTLNRNGTLKAESSIGSEDDLGRMPGREKETPKSDFTAKADSADNVFIEDVRAQEIKMKPDAKIMTALLCPFTRLSRQSTSILAKR
jgi:hypothetical protein